MNRESTLRTLIVLDVFLAFATMGAAMFFDWTLPGSLQDYPRHRPWLEWSATGGIAFLLWAGSIACSLAAWVALANFWWAGRRLYVVAWSSWVLLTLFSGPSVLNPVSATFSTLASVTGGLILGLVYWSDLAHRFERRPAAVRSGITASA